LAGRGIQKPARKRRGQRPTAGALSVSPSEAECSYSWEPAEAECSYGWEDGVVPPRDGALSPDLASSVSELEFQKEMEKHEELGQSPDLLTVAHSNLQPEGERVSDMEEDEVLPASPVKPRRRPYTRQEQQKIVDYLVKQDAFAMVGGNRVWQQMEAAGVCRGGRTWQSMKEHFRRQLVHRINTFGLSSQQVHCFRAALKQDKLSASAV
jgi:hypothetical protein